MDFSSAAELLKICQASGIPISQAMIDRETLYLGADTVTTYSRMEHSYEIMKNAVHSAVTEDIRSIGGLIGGEAKKMDAYRASTEKPLCGSVISKAIGYLITRNATVAGAEGGCQAEVGAASAMAASAAVELMGGTPEQCMSAAGTAITNILGLVCDPIAGLVEAPCQKRNAMGASNAIVAAQITLAGVGNLLPLDEVIDVMYSVGRSIPFELRETALGGVAGSPTGCRLSKQIFG